MWHISFSSLLRETGIKTFASKHILFTDQISSSLEFARYISRPTTHRLTSQWNQKLNSCVSTAECVLADRAEITYSFPLRMSALNSTSKNFTTSLLWFHAELKYTGSQRVLSDPKDWAHFT